ncbi:hypothetical protein F511_30865 [Dorcoceras hygrometricum]|uniref:Uncharacterized protein n=1 Tax=Dorcoceras hygrometricum TaxID=472368 RepID=A0A2Z7CR39_9LAMI|nr:hypothetical protein F511_30865 [Dorcoceras hygrometricum]
MQKVIGAYRGLIDIFTKLGGRSEILGILVVVIIAQKLKVLLLRTSGNTVLLISLQGYLLAAMRRLDSYNALMSFENSRLSDLVILWYRVLRRVDSYHVLTCSVATTLCYHGFSAGHGDDSACGVPGVPLEISLTLLLPPALSPAEIVLPVKIWHHTFTAHMANHITWRNVSSLTYENFPGVPLEISLNLPLPPALSPKEIVLPVKIWHHTFTAQMANQIKRRNVSSLTYKNFPGGHPYQCCSHPCTLNSTLTYTFAQLSLASHGSRL